MTCYWRREWQPTPVLLPGKSHGQGSLAGYSRWGHKELDTTKWMTCYMECLFISLFSISIFSLVRCLLRSLAYFTFLLFVFLLLSFKYSLYILDNCPLSDISFAIILSQSLASLLILLVLSVIKKILIVIKSSLSFFSFLCCLWWWFFVFLFFLIIIPKVI